MQLALKELDIDDADYFALAASQHRYSPEQEGRIERVMGESSPRIKNAQRRIVQKAQYEQRVMREMLPKSPDCRMHWALISISGKIHRNSATIRAHCRIMTAARTV